MCVQERILHILFYFYKMVSHRAISFSHNIIYVPKDLCCYDILQYYNIETRQDMMNVMKQK